MKEGESPPFSLRESRVERGNKKVNETLTPRPLRLPRRGLAMNGLDPTEEAARALEARASRRDEAADELARTAAQLAEVGSVTGVKPILRASRGHRIRALQDRVAAAALRLNGKTGCG